MLFGGVSVDDRLVRDLAAILEMPLGRKLEQALFFRAKIVALTWRRRRRFWPPWKGRQANSRKYEHSLWLTPAGACGSSAELVVWMVTRW